MDIISAAMTNSPYITTFHIVFHSIAFSDFSLTHLTSYCTWNNLSNILLQCGDKSHSHLIFISVSSNLSEMESRLPKSKLILLCKNELILKWMCNCDHVMYQALVEILIPDVLRPIPSKIYSRHDYFWILVPGCTYWD